MILLESLKIKLDYKPLTDTSSDYNNSGYRYGDKLVLVSNDIKALDTFVQAHSKGYVTITDLIKDLQKCKDVYFGECYSSSSREYSVVGYSNSFKYVYALSPSILNAINRKEIDE